MLQRIRPTETSLKAWAIRGFALSMLMALCVSLLPTFEATAKQKNKKNQITTGRIEVSTNPGGYPIFIDGQPAGETTEYVRAIELQPGPHTVEIQFPNNTRWAQPFNIVAGRKNCIALNYRPRTFEVPPVANIPCPYPVSISAPATAGDGDTITFSAAVGYQGQSGLNYTWTVSPPSARIIEGAGTPTITVDTTGVGSRRVTAILVVDDGSGNRNCRQTAQASTAVTKPELPENAVGDDFVSMTNDADKARLDYHAIKLQENPNYRAYVIAYGGRNSCREQAEILIRCAIQYLTRDRGIDASRITTINGGYREQASYEVWVQSPGKPTPTPKPTVSESEVRSRRPCTRRCG